MAFIVWANNQTKYTLTVSIAMKNDQYTLHYRTEVAEFVVAGSRIFNVVNAVPCYINAICFCDSSWEDSILVCQKLLFQLVFGTTVWQ